jgi:hypothetical protein
MYLNTDPIEPLGKPCIRDMHELLRDHLPASLIMLTPLQELERRCHEIAAQHPRFREEVPLVLRGEAQRRTRLSGLLQVSVNHFQVA